MNKTTAESVENVSAFEDLAKEMPRFSKIFKDLVKNFEDPSRSLARSLKILAGSSKILEDPLFVVR